MSHVEIAGAGLSGLTAAAAFAKAGWSVRVHEKSSELREIGAGIYLWENGLRALEEIGALFGDTNIANTWYGLTEEKKNEIWEEAMREERGGRRESAERGKEDVERVENAQP